MQWKKNTLVAHQRTGPKFMALLTVSKESALTEAGNSVLMASVFHRLAANFGFCACVLHVTRHSTLTRLAQKFGACTCGEKWPLAKNSAVNRAMKLGPGNFTWVTKQNYGHGFIALWLIDISSLCPLFTLSPNTHSALCWILLIQPTLIPH